MHGRRVLGVEGEDVAHDQDEGDDDGAVKDGHGLGQVLDLANQFRKRANQVADDDQHLDEGQSIHD